jgi:hypothetical protein
VVAEITLPMITEYPAKIINELKENYPPKKQEKSKESGRYLCAVLCAVSG